MTLMGFFAISNMRVKFVDLELIDELACNLAEISMVSVSMLVF